MRTAPQRKRFGPPKVRRGFTSHAQNARRTTATAIRPAQSAQRAHFAFSNRAPRHSESDSTHPKRADGSLCIFKMRTVPQRERCDPPKVRRGLTLPFQNTHRATARAIRPTQSAQKVHFTFASATARAIGPTQMLRLLRHARKYCACHEICTKSSKVRRMPRNLHKKL